MISIGNTYSRNIFKICKRLMPFLPGLAGVVGVVGLAGALGFRISSIRLKREALSIYNDNNDVGYFHLRPTYNGIGLS